MENRSYTEELRAQLGSGRRRPREHDRDIARLLSPWRRHGATGGTEGASSRG
jgi:hypothetical protein